MSPNWGAAAEMLLTTGWSAGIPARQIAEAISILTGQHCTRNSVIGKADRIGLPRHPLANGVSYKSLPPSPSAPAAQMQARA
jgi:hypothetical protein